MTRTFPLLCVLSLGVGCGAGLLVQRGGAQEVDRHARCSRATATSEYCRFRGGSGDGIYFWCPTLDMSNFQTAIRESLMN